MQREPSLTIQIYRLKKEISKSKERHAVSWVIVHTLRALFTRLLMQRSSFN